MRLQRLIFFFLLQLRVPIRATFCPSWQISKMQRYPGPSLPGSLPACDILSHITFTVLIFRFDMILKREPFTRHILSTYYAGEKKKQ